MKDRKIKNREIISAESPFEFKGEYLSRTSDNLHRFHFVETSQGTFQCRSSVAGKKKVSVFKTSERGCSCNSALVRELAGQRPSCLHISALTKLLKDVTPKDTPIYWDEDDEEDYSGYNVFELDEA